MTKNGHIDTTELKKLLRMLMFVRNGLADLGLTTRAQTLTKEIEAIMAEQGLTEKQVLPIKN